MKNNGQSGARSGDHTHTLLPSGGSQTRGRVAGVTGEALPLPPVVGAGSDQTRSSVAEATEGGRYPSHL